MAASFPFPAGVVALVFERLDTSLPLSVENMRFGSFLQYFSTPRASSSHKMKGHGHIWFDRFLEEQWYEHHTLSQWPKDQYNPYKNYLEYTLTRVPDSSKERFSVFTSSFILIRKYWEEKYQLLVPDEETKQFLRKIDCSYREGFLNAATLAVNCADELIVDTLGEIFVVDTELRKQAIAKFGPIPEDLTVEEFICQKTDLSPFDPTSLMLAEEIDNDNYRAVTELTGRFLYYMNALAN